MSKWTVVDEEAGVLALQYSWTKQGVATTFAARMGNGEMMIVSPSTGLDDETASELEKYGPVGALVANNGFHYLGQAGWRERYPDVRCFAPDVAATRIKKKSKGTLDFEPLEALSELTGDEVGVRNVPNTRIGESWFWAKCGDGYAWYASDVVANMPKLPSAFIPRMLFKFTDSAPGYRVFNLALKFGVKDKNGTLKLFLDDLEAHPPSTVVPGHGGILSGADIAEQTESLVRSVMG